MENKLIKIEKNEISKVVENSGVEIKVANQVTENYQKFFIELGQIQENAIKINFENPTQIDETIARELRLATVKIRKSAEGLKIARKKQYLLRGNLEQSVYNLIKDGCKLIEDTFGNVEKAREIAEKKRIENLRLERTEKIIEYVDNVNIYPLGQMSENDFDSLLIGFQVAKEKKEKDEKEAEEKRLAEIEKEKQRLIEIKKENERLRKEADIKEKARLAEIEEIRKVQDAKDKKERLRLAEKARLAKEKRAKEETERKILAKKEAERQATLQAELRAKAEKERKEKERIEKELKEQKETERLRLAEIESKKQAELSKGDLDKVKDLINDLTELKTKYTFKSAKNSRMYYDVGLLIDKVVNHIKK